MKSANRSRHLRTVCSFDGTAADHHIAVIEHNGLPLGKGALRFVKRHGKSVLFDLLHGGPLLRLLIADLCFDTQRRGDAVCCDEVDVLCGQCLCVQPLVRAKHDAVVCHVLFTDVQRGGERKPKAAALTDGIADDAFVCAEHAAVARHKVAVRESAAEMLFDKCGIIAVRYKADVLTFMLFCIDKTVR